MDGQTDGGTNTLASRGLEEPKSLSLSDKHSYTRFAWAGGTFFPVVLLCQFWFWREIGFGCTSDGCAVLAITTDRKKKIQSSVCSVGGSGDYDRKKKIQSSVWWVVLWYCFL